MNALEFKPRYSSINSESAAEYKNIPANKPRVIKAGTPIITFTDIFGKNYQFPFRNKKQLLDDFVNKTCLYQSPEATRRDYNWSKLHKILVENFNPKHIGEELAQKLNDIYKQDEENDK